MSGVDTRPGQKGGEGISFATQGRHNNITLMRMLFALSTADSGVNGLAVYVSSTTGGQRLVWVLPRSPVIRARREHWARATREFVKAGGFSEVLVVAGVDAASRTDEGLRR